MLAYAARRVFWAAPTLLVLIVLCYVLMYLAPGGPFTTERALPPQVLANIEAKYGLDKPLYAQIWDYVVAVVTRFDFGPSFVYKDRDVYEIMARGFPVTLTYGTISFISACLVGVSLGVLAAVRHNSVLDYIAVGATFSAQALPNFVMAPILVIVFTWQLGWLPGGGWSGGQWQYVVMPVIALSTSFMASIARITRSSMLEVLNSGFIRTARARGLSPTTILWRHAMKPAMLPVVSYLGPVFVAMITGSVLVDLYFSTGGIGLSYVNAALNRDYAVMLGVTILYGTLTIAFNLLVDLLYAWLDPRIRY
ncbi:MAG: oligopeptide ABC transporter permease OppB [Albidovulum sp.]|nr:oligopeptide ABC transporter permease OppB [Albidovulum sp.]